MSNPVKSALIRTMVKKHCPLVFEVTGAGDLPQTTLTEDARRHIAERLSALGIAKIAPVDVNHKALKEVEKTLREKQASA